MFPCSITVGATVAKTVLAAWLLSKKPTSATFTQNPWSWLYWYACRFYNLSSRRNVGFEPPQNAGFWGNTYQRGNRLWHNTGALRPVNARLFTPVLPRLRSPSFIVFIWVIYLLQWVVSTVIPAVERLPGDSDRVNQCLFLFRFLSAVIQPLFSREIWNWWQTEQRSESQSMHRRCHFSTLCNQTKPTDPLLSLLLTISLK